MGLFVLATALPGLGRAREAGQNHKTRPRDSQTICSARKGLPVGSLRDDAEKDTDQADIGSGYRRKLDG